MGAQEKSTAAKNSMQRVKVYRLNNEGKWDDQGTGHVTVDQLERSQDLGLFVVDEDDNETLLSHRISSDDIYRKQEDTIISWSDPEYSTELALSFQESTGCSYIWDQICGVRRNMQFNALNYETYHGINSELRELPPVELSTLPLILKTLVESGIADQIRVTELILHDQDFFQKLMDLFTICEDLENRDGLHMIFKIVRGIILLNSPQIFEKVFGDEFLMFIIGALEYDPDIPHVQHRSFLKEHVVFKEAIPIKDPLVRSKIHQTYRVNYLKDVILPGALDDATIANLNSIIHSNNATIISLLKDDSTFIQELFGRLRSTTSRESKKNLVHLLHEFCSLSKSLQMVQQHRLFRDLVNEGIFSIVADILQNEEKKLVLIGTDILILFLNQDPNLLRSYVTRVEGNPLIGLLGVHPCDRRRSVSEYKLLFPAIDFSLIESNPDILWKPDRREKDEELAARGMKFLNWLWTRREKEIAVVTHSAFLIHTLSAFGNDCHPVIQNEIRSPFKNCELRSVVIVDRSMMGSDSSTTNYPGKIPSGADLPSDAAKEKHPGVEVPK